MDKEARTGRAKVRTCSTRCLSSAMQASCRSLTSLRDLTVSDSASSCSARAARADSSSATRASRVDTARSSSCAHRFSTSSLWP